MMSQVKLQAARELISERHYDAARTILETMPNNSTAAKWLALLNQRNQSPVKSKTTAERIAVIAVIVAILLLSGLGCAYFQEQAASKRAAREYTCSIIYARYSPQWQNCVDAD